jgi:hypothetical protein
LQQRSQQGVGVTVQRHGCSWQVGWAHTVSLPLPAW